MSLSILLAEKSVQAALSAIEIYNKPDFRFREEAFSILMCNAWELLLKAKWLLDHDDEIGSLHEANTDGTVRLNRCGNPMTVSGTYLANKLRQDVTSGFTQVFLSNLEGLIEIRDNATHFINTNPELGQRVLEVGMGSVQNYVLLARDWFQIDFSRYNFYLMPISFFNAFETVTTLSMTPPSEQAARLLEYLKGLDSLESSEPGGPYIACRLQTSLIRAKDSTGITFRFSNDPNAPAVNVREEDFLKSYPYTYKDLTKNLKTRYGDFLENERYHSVRKPLEKIAKFCIERRLNPGNPSSSRQRFYNVNIVAEFDKHYEKRKRS